MKHFRMTGPKDQRPPASPEKPREPEDAFDLWLQRGLHELYDKIASEPVPEELLRLIEEDQQK